MILPADVPIDHKDIVRVWIPWEGRIDSHAQFQEEFCIGFLDGIFLIVWVAD